LIGKLGLLRLVLDQSLAIIFHVIQIVDALANVIQLSEYVVERVA
jgi:hypothetical protein